VAENVLMWITCARTTMTTTQLRHALATKPFSLEPDEDDIATVEDILTACTGMVVEDETSGIIRLVHFTAQDYFQRTRAKWFPDAESALALHCLWYLSFDVFCSGPCRSDEEFQSKLHTFAMYKYAAENRGRHYSDAQPRSAKQPGQELFDTAVGFLLNRQAVSSSAQILFESDGPGFILKQLCPMVYI
jgi:hypothetical protein